MDAMFTTYPRLLASFRTLVEELTPAEQDAVFATNAERRLPHLSPAGTSAAVRPTTPGTRPPEPRGGTACRG